MGMDWGKPTTTDNYSTVFVPAIQANQAALAAWLDSGSVSLSGTTPVGTKRYNATSSAIEQWNGSAWAPITLHGLQFDASTVSLGLGAAPTANERVRVNGVEARIRSRNSTSGAELYLGAMNPNEARLWASTTTPLTFGTDNLERMRLDASGNLGIGTASATQARVEVRKIAAGVTFDALALANYAGSAVGSAVALYLDPNGAGTLARAASIRSVQAVAGNYADLRFYVANSSTPAEAMRVAHDGRVSIGGYTPVRGFGVGNPTDEFGVDVGSATTRTYMGGNQSGSAVLTHVFDRTSGDAYWANGIIGGTLAERMRITGTGLLGIGVAPAYRLDVAESSGAANLVARFRNTAAAAFAEMQVASNDRALVMGQRSSTHASGDLAYLYTAAATPIAFFTNSAERVRITADGRLYGTALHNNAGSMAGTSSQFIASGTYTPTTTNVANISSSTPRKCTWVRVGNVVRVSGACSVTTAAGAGTATQLRVSLPIPSALAVGDLYGGGNFSALTTMVGGGIGADAANDEALLVWTANAAATFETQFSFQYEVL